MFSQQYYREYLAILKEELLPALGCTEPSAVAYGAAMLRELLPSFPTKIVIEASGNILKNAKSVVVPHTGGLKGMQASILAGLVGGNSSLGLGVLSNLTPTHALAITALMNSGLVTIKELESSSTLHMIITAWAEEHEAIVEIKNQHTNVVRLTLDGDDRLTAKCEADVEVKALTDRSVLSVDAILDFIEMADPQDYSELLEQQIDCNTAIALEGLKNDYGVGVGKSILKYSQSLEGKVKAYTAAGSDARMSGSSLPVVTNSGSGNQGMTCSTSVITYAREKNYPHDRLLKALLLSNLVTIHIKTGITRLSCYCGAIVAASGASAGFAYLDGLSRDQIKMAITNVLGNVSGVVCDGAKESCPSKIASGIEAAFQGLHLAADGKVYSHGCGIIEHNIEATIANVGRLGREGMSSTDKVVLDIMTHISN